MADDLTPTLDGARVTPLPNGRLAVWLDAEDGCTFWSRTGSDAMTRDEALAMADDLVDLLDEHEVVAHLERDADWADGLAQLLHDGCERLWL